MAMMITSCIITDEATEDNLYGYCNHFHGESCPQWPRAGEHNQGTHHRRISQTLHDKLAHDCLWADGKDDDCLWAEGMDDDCLWAEG